MKVQTISYEKESKTRVEIFLLSEIHLNAKICIKVNGAENSGHCTVFYSFFFILDSTRGGWRMGLGMLVYLFICLFKIKLTIDKT